MGNRQAAEFFPARGVKAEELAVVAQLASFADETPVWMTFWLRRGQRINSPSFAASRPQGIWWP
jgi:K+-transporting ATPase ATPase B chain